VAGRGAHRSARQPDPHLGTAWQPTHRATRSALPVCLSVWRRLSGAWRWCWARFTACQCPRDEPASARNQHAGEPGGVRRAHAGWRWMASGGGSPGGAGQHWAAPSSALLTRTLIRFAAQAGRKRLGVPPPERSQQPGLCNLPGDRRRVLFRLEQTHRRTRTDPLDRYPRLCQNGQLMSRLV
jgi:hypothetical protein